MMETLGIALPRALKEFVEQVSNGQSGSASDHVRKLIQADRKRKAREQQDATLREGLDSGKPIEVTPQFWEERRQELRRRLAAKAKKGKK